MLKLIIASAMLSIALVATGIFIGVLYKNAVINIASGCVDE